MVCRTPLALVPNPRDLDDLLKTIERVKPTLFSAVPALFIALLNHPRVKARKVDFSSIRACFSGAAPLLAATKAHFEELSGGRIVEGYSLTEAMMACVVNPLAGISKLGSVGLPLPDVEVAIVDAETGERLLPTRRNRRDSSPRPAAHVGILERIPTKPRGPFGGMTPAARGCTQETSDISTPTPICSSSIDRRISSRRADTRCGRGKWKRCSRCIRTSWTSASQEFPTMSKARW